MQTRDRIIDIVASKIEHFDYKNQDEVIEMLALIGLKHYTILYPNQVLHLSALILLCEKYISELDPISWKRPKQTDYQAPPIPPVQRATRPDSLSHFPFFDEFGSVPDILHRQVTEKPKILEIGPPQRKKLIIQVFNEMRFDKRGIRLSDIPQALENLGIDISAKLKKLLLKTRSKHLNGPLNIDDDDSASHQSNYKEKYITLAQWQLIVKNFIVLLKQGKRPEDLDKLILVDDFYKKSPYGRGLTDDEYEDALTEEGTEEAKHNRHHRGAEDEEDDDEMSGGEEYVNMALSKADKYRLQRKPTNYSFHHQKKKSQQHRKDPLKEQAQQYYSRIQNASSRIAHQIQHDKLRHQHDQYQTQRDAYGAIAKKQANEFIQTPAHTFLEDKAKQQQLMRSVPIVKPPQIHHNNRNHHSSSSDGKESFLDIMRSTAQMKANQFKPPTTTTTRNRDRKFQFYGRPAEFEIDSGRAALEIADTFLNSKLGQELTSSAGEENLSDVFLDDMSPHQAEKTVANIFGLKKVVKGSSQSNLPYDFKTAREKAIERKLDDESKHLYASGWKSTSGGWVADFGPAHTHPSYTGPEIHRPTSTGRSRHSSHEHIIASTSAQQQQHPGVDELAQTIRTTIPSTHAIHHSSSQSQKKGDHMFIEEDESVSMDSPWHIAGGRNVRDALNDEEDDMIAGLVQQGIHSSSHRVHHHNVHSNEDEIDDEVVEDGNAHNLAISSQKQRQSTQSLQSTPATGLNPPSISMPSGATPKPKYAPTQGHTSAADRMTTTTANSSTAAGITATITRHDYMTDRTNHDHVILHGDDVLNNTAPVTNTAMTASTIVAAKDDGTDGTIRKVISTQQEQTSQQRTDSTSSTRNITTVTHINTIQHHHKVQKGLEEEEEDYDVIDHASLEDDEDMHHTMPISHTITTTTTTTASSRNSASRGEANDITTSMKARNHRQHSTSSSSGATSQVSQPVTTTTTTASGAPAMSLEDKLRTNLARFGGPATTTTTAQSATATTTTATAASSSAAAMYMGAIDNTTLSNHSIPPSPIDGNQSESTIDAAVAGAGEGGISGFFDESDMDLLLQLPETMSLQDMVRRSK